MRCWSNRRADDGSVHAIGNGNMLLYGVGPNIMKILGPPYSAPEFLSMELDAMEEASCQSVRIPHTAIWEHKLNIQNTMNFFTDYMFMDKNIFVREIKAASDINFTVHLGSDVKGAHQPRAFTKPNGDYCEALFLKLPKGSRFFMNDTINIEISMGISIIGRGTIALHDHTASVHIPSGSQSLLVFTSGSFGEMIELLEYAYGCDQAVEKARIYQAWCDFSARRHNFETIIPDSFPQKQKIMEAIDSVSVLTKCQQSSGGGVTAGHIYPEAYVRDQAGVFRGYLSLGYWEEARKILDFWFNKWSIRGFIYNADGMDNHCAVLDFGNDEVEIPAYVVNSAMLYFDVTQDDCYIKTLLPMLLDMVKVQIKHLEKGMTEFSGDETYIAGFIFPRSQIFNGSAESTMLFIHSTEKLLRFIERYNLDPQTEIAESVKAAKLLYRENFFRDPILYANNPEREKRRNPPRFKISFCEICLSRHVYNLEWCERDTNGYYVCDDCKSKHQTLPKAPHLRYILNSVSLIPAYLHNDILSPDEIKSIVAQVTCQYQKYHFVPSDLNDTKALGYDMGLYLYNLTYVGEFQLAQDVLENILGLLDQTDAWSEYYEKGVAYNCRCRPWESCMNIEAIIFFIQKYFK